MSDRLGLYYATITETFSLISEGIYEHSFAIIPATTCLGWRKLSSFVGEKKCQEVDSLGAMREYSIMEFVDAGHQWVIKTTRCKHPRRAFGDDWRFVVYITRDGEEISHSQIPIDDFVAYVCSVRNA